MKNLVESLISAYDDLVHRYGEDILIVLAIIAFMVIVND